MLHSLTSIKDKCGVVSAVSELAIGSLDSGRCFKNLVNICYFPSKHEQAHLKFVHHYLALSGTINFVVFIPFLRHFFKSKARMEDCGCRNLSTAVTRDILNARPSRESLLGEIPGGAGVS